MLFFYKYEKKNGMVISIIFGTTRMGMDCGIIIPITILFIVNSEQRYDFHSLGLFDSLYLSSENFGLSFLVLVIYVNASYVFPQFCSCAPLCCFVVL